MQTCIWLWYQAVRPAADRRMSPLCSVLPRDSKLYIPSGMWREAGKKCFPLSPEPWNRRDWIQHGQKQSRLLFMRHFIHLPFQLGQSMVDPETIYSRVESSFPIPTVKTPRCQSWVTGHPGRGRGLGQAATGADTADWTNRGPAVAFQGKQGRRQDRWAQVLRNTVTWILFLTVTFTF